MTRVRLRIRIIRIDDVTHFGSESEDARVAHRFVGKGLEPGAAGDKRDRDIEGRAEFGGIVACRTMFGGERLPESVYVPFGGLAQDLGDLFGDETILRQPQRAIDIGLIHGAGRIGLEAETFHQPLFSEIAREGIEIAFPGPSKSGEEPVRAFEYGARPEESLASDARRVQPDSRRPSRVEAFGPGPFGEIFDDPARHAARYAERVDRLLAIEPERNRH